MGWQLCWRTQLQVGTLRPGPTPLVRGILPLTRPFLAACGTGFSFPTLCPNVYSVFPSLRRQQPTWVSWSHERCSYAIAPRTPRTPATLLFRGISTTFASPPPAAPLTANSVRLQGMSFGEAIAETPAAIVEILFALGFGLSLIGLCSYHMQLVRKGATTNEEVSARTCRSAFTLR